MGSFSGKIDNRTVTNTTASRRPFQSRRYVRQLYPETSSYIDSWAVLEPLAVEGKRLPLQVKVNHSQLLHQPQPNSNRFNNKLPLDNITSQQQQQQQQLSPIMPRSPVNKTNPSPERKKPVWLNGTKPTPGTTNASTKFGSKTNKPDHVTSATVAATYDSSPTSHQSSDHTPRRRRGVKNLSSKTAVKAKHELTDIDLLPAYDALDASKASSLRLRCILSKLRASENVSKNVLIVNLEYAANVLDAVYRAESLRVCDEEDELRSETETLKSVPNEVRDWLTMTFTRSLTNVKRTQDRLHFRSVANAIRAGIVVDRIYRRMSSTVGLHVPPDVLFKLKTLDDWTFDVFEINEIGEGHALKYVGYELLQKCDLINKFKINTQALDNFLLRLEQGYSKHSNPYHNLLHAADVTQTTYHLLSQSGLAMWLTDLEIFAVMIAAMIHDFEHTGTTNAFHVNTSSDLALTYNDRAVLENYHSSAVFKLMKDEGCDIVSNLRKEEFKEFRSVVIDIVLATDMSFHFQQVKNMKNLLTMPENIDKSKALSMLVHCADISHPAKNWKLHARWTDLLVEEFFRQGDKELELGLQLSPLCDRKNTMISESQIGFIDFIVEPSFQVMGDMLDKIIIPLQRQRHQQQQQQQQLGNNSTVDGKLLRKTSTLSIDSEQSSDSGAGSSPSHSSRKGYISSVRTPARARVFDYADDGFEVKRYWDECLRNNKTCWKEKAVIDAQNKAKKDLIGETTSQAPGTVTDNKQEQQEQNEEPQDDTA